MSMSITVTLTNGAVIESLITGKYSPDVMHDLKNRVIELVAAASELPATTNPIGASE